jgi:hypothetical protein
VDPELEKMEIDTIVGTYEPYTTRFPLHLGGFVLIHTNIRWMSGLHENFMSPMKKIAPL